MGATSSTLGLGDLALTWDNAQGSADLSIVDGDLATDRGLETAILISLFTDRRAEDDDQPPSGAPSDRRGWWADQFATTEGDRIGSRLWLLDRSVVGRETEQVAEFYTREALAWMIQDRVVAGVDVLITTGSGSMLIAVTLARPGKDPVTFRFQNVWDHQT